MWKDQGGADLNPGCIVNGAMLFRCDMKKGSHGDKGHLGRKLMGTVDVRDVDVRRLREDWRRLGEEYYVWRTSRGQEAGYGLLYLRNFSVILTPEFVP